VFRVFRAFAPIDRPDVARCHQAATSPHEFIEVLTIATGIRVREANPHAPRTLDVIDGRILLDAKQQGSVRASHSRTASHHYSGGVKDCVRCIPAARPLPAITSAILREASSIISSPSIAAPRAPPAADVYHSYASRIISAWS